MNRFVQHVQLDDNIELRLGTNQDLKLEHTGSNATITNNTGNLTIQNNTDDGDISFLSDNGSGGTATYLALDGGLGYTRAYKDIRFEDDKQALFGTGSDLKLYHDGTDSYVTNNTGHLLIYQNGDDKDIIFRNDNGSGGTTPYLTLDGGDVSTIVNTIKVLMPNLPTSDPSVAGQLYNDSGTLKISAG